MATRFWDGLERFVECCGQHLSPWSGLQRERVALYASGIVRLALPLDLFADFSDCTNHKIAKPLRINSNKFFVYSGHEIVYCLMYMTIKTSDRLRSNLLRPVEDRHQDLTPSSC